MLTITSAKVTWVTTRAVALKTIMMMTRRGDGVVDDDEEEDGYDNSDNNGVRTVVVTRSWRKRRRMMGLMTLELKKDQHLAHKPAPLVSADHSQAPPSSLAHS